jgi:hypothetical protein
MSENLAIANRRFFILGAFADRIGRSGGVRTVIAIVASRLFISGSLDIRRSDGIFVILNTYCWKRRWYNW